VSLCIFCTQTSLIVEYDTWLYTMNKWKPRTERRNQNEIELTQKKPLTTQLTFDFHAISYALNIQTLFINMN